MSGARWAVPVVALVLSCLVLGCEAHMRYQSAVGDPIDLPMALRAQGAGAAGSEPVPLAYERGGADDDLGPLHDAKPPPDAEGPTRRTSLAEVVRIAWEQSRQVLLAEARLDQARGRTQEVDGGLWPELRIDGGAGLIHGREVSNFGDTRDVTFARFDPGIALAYSLDVGAQAIGAKAARRDQDAAALDHADTRRQAARTAALAYHDVVVTRAAIDIAGQLVADAEDFLRIAEARAASGIASEADVALAQAELATARRARLAAQARWKETSTTLAVLLRWDPGVFIVPAEREIRPTARVSTQDPAVVTAGALSARPDLKAAGRRIDAAKHRRAAVRWDVFAPDLALEVRERALATQSSSLGDTTMVRGFLGWTFRLGDIGRARRAAAEQREAEIELEATRDRIAGEIHAGIARLQALEASVAEARAGLEAAERSHRIQIARFEAGNALGVEVIQAQNAAARARLELVDTVLRYNAEQVDLLAASGHLDPEALTASDGLDGSRPQ